MALMQKPTAMQIEQKQLLAISKKHGVCRALCLLMTARAKMFNIIAVRPINNVLMILKMWSNSLGSKGAVELGSAGAAIWFQRGIGYGLISKGIPYFHLHLSFRETVGIVSECEFYPLYTARNRVAKDTYYHRVVQQEAIETGLTFVDYQKRESVTISNTWLLETPALCTGIRQNARVNYINIISTSFYLQLCILRSKQIRTLTPPPIVNSIVSKLECSLLYIFEDRCCL